MAGKKNILFRSLIPLLLLWSCSGADETAPVARRGVIDLSAVDMTRSAAVRLDGEWEFYWNQLLSPPDFHGARAPAATGYITLPDSWRGFNDNGKKLDGTGYATLRLQILPAQEVQDLALQIDLVNSAYRLWINDELRIENGVIGRNSREEVPIQSFQRAYLHVEDRPIELVMEISNYHDREGGMVSSLLLGPADRLASEQMKRRSLTLIGIGCLMVMGIYHVFLYIFRTKNAAPLYFGIYCLLWMIFFLTNNANGWPVRMFIGRIPAYLLNRIDLICVVVSVPVLYGFLRALYPGEFSRRLQRVTWITAGVFLVPGLAASTMAFTSIIFIYYIFCMMLICYLLIMLTAAIRRKRECAVYILLGFSVLGLVSINDMLYDLQVIRSVYLMEVGMVGFIFFQAVALSLRFSRAFSSVERLSDELAGKNVVLEREIDERTRLEREIVNTSEDERRRISRELHDGLCQKLTGARLQFSVLARKLPGADKQAGELASVSSLLEESVNQAYDLSRGLWPVEYDPKGISPSLEELARRLSESSGIAIEFSQKRGCENCSNAAVIQLYRIAQEAITNAVKHARPGKIIVGLNCLERNRITLAVQDNGIGRSAAAPTRGGLGISIMSHRARMINGELTVADAEGGGTLVTCVVPCGAGAMN
jgi:signal transduction histidine kinase